MTYLRISERARDGGTFHVTLSFENGGEHVATIVDPFAGAPEREELLAWYFEEHLRYPFLDRDLADAARKAVSDYGVELFGQLFPSGSDASYELRKARDRGFDRLQIEIVGSIAFQRLHWEALDEPGAGPTPPLGVRVPLVRRAAEVRAGFDVDATPPTLNVLVVTARPDGPNDVGYRTISRPLLGALRRARVPVNVDFVRPGTWDALSRHLQQTTQEHGSGWYRIVHFDVHGAMGRPEDFGVVGDGNGYRFEIPGDQTGGDREALLFFETDTDGDADPIPTEQVAALLVEHRVPVAVMNACQSAMSGDSEASLAHHLVAAGVPVALGMAYSVTVTAAELMMPVLYQELADGRELLPSVHSARRRIFDVKRRRAYFDHEVELEDWMLPVLFWQRAVGVQPVQPTPEQQAEILERQAQRIDEPQPEYGFVGRDLDVQAVERRLLGDDAPNLLLLRAMAGAGKTTLLEHLAWWWQATGLVSQVLAFTYEDRAWTTDQIVQTIASALLDVQALAIFQTRSSDVQMEEVAMLLRGHRHVLILDNAESITATPASIPHALPPEEQQRLHHFLSRLRGGRTLVLLGSRSDEQWLARNTFGSNMYSLGGLDPQAASELVERILKRHAIPRPVDAGEQQALESLVDLLGGYPLPLTVVLPRLAAMSPSQLFSDLRKGGEDADPTRLVQRAIELSHGRLDPALQNSLMLLAPFTAVIPRAGLDIYRDLLQEAAPVRELGELDLAAAVKEAVSVGLARTVGSQTRMHPMLPYFLRTRLNQHPDLAAAAAHAHHALYNIVAHELCEGLFSDDDARRTQARTIAHTEYPNLHSAFRYGCDHGAPPKAIVGALDELLDQSNNHHARKELLDEAIAVLTPTPPTTERDEHLAALHNLAGIAALGARRLNDARHHHTKELELRPPEATGLVAMAYHQLGRVAQEQWRLEEAEAHYQEALKLELELELEVQAATTYNQLAIIAHMQHRLDDGRGYLDRSLALAKKTGDAEGELSALHQLGIFFQSGRQFEEAIKHFGEALDLARKHGMTRAIAKIYHELGRAEQLSGDARSAEQHYRESLRLKLQQNDLHGAAHTHLQLGNFATDQERFEEAERNYLRASELFLRSDDTHGYAISSGNLGAVLTKALRAEDAVRHSLTALSYRAIAPESTARDISALVAQQDLLGEEAFSKIVDALVDEASREHLAKLLSQARAQRQDAAEDSN